jgi:dihydrofolate reductase
MRKVIMFNLMTIDGFFEGLNHDISWHNVDPEFNDHAINEMFPASDVLLFGRVTCEFMAGFWPTPEAKRDEPIIAEKMNASPKVVFSRTLKEAQWNNTRLVKGNMEEEVRRLKEQPGKGLAILGSGSIVSQLAQRGLIDEYQIMVNPLILGRGHRCSRVSTADWTWT